jgi:hypothetical protein
MQWKQWIPIGLAALYLSSCAPQIYVVDRHTIMEEEAAGEWPDVEKEWMGQAKAQGPVRFPKTPESEKKKRLYNTLNGELVK